MVTSLYIENYTSWFGLNKQEDGESYAFTLPIKDKKIPWTALPDLGALVASAFTKTEELVGMRIGQASFYATGDEIAEILTKATGKTIQYNCVPWETFASLGFPEELAQMFEHWFR